MINTQAVSTAQQMSIGNRDSFRDIPKSEINGTYSSSILIYWRILTISYSGGHDFYSSWQWVNGSFLHIFACTHYLPPLFCNIQSYYSEALVISDTEHFKYTCSFVSFLWRNTHLFYGCVFICFCSLCCFSNTLGDSLSTPGPSQIIFFFWSVCYLSPFIVLDPVQKSWVVHALRILSPPPTCLIPISQKYCLWKFI